MNEFNIEVQGGSSVRLPTAGKYCDRDIIVTASGGGGGGTEDIITITTAITNVLEAYNTFSAFMNEGENIAVFANTKKLDEITAKSYGVYAVIGTGEKGAFYRNQATNAITNIINANYDFRIFAGDTFKKVVLF